MPQLPITFIKGDKMGSETDYRDSLPINMSAVMRPLFGAAGYMIQQPGLVKYSDTVGADRGGLWNERQLNHYRVSGGKFISVDDAGAVTELGDIPGTDNAIMPYSFNTQAIIANNRMWLYDSINGFREITDPDLGNPIDGVWIDGYYFLTDGEFIYHTDITDESSIDPLKFATAEFSPDPSLGLLKTNDNKVMVFGRYSTEYFINVAGEQFAFQRVPTRAVKAGIVGTHCKAEMSGGVYILGGRKEEAVSVHVLGVGSLQKVATREVDKVIGKYNETELSGVVLEARVEDGYYYLIMHLPNETLMFNETIARSQGVEQAWTILNSGDLDTNYQAIHGIYEPRKGVWVYGDKVSPRLGVLNESEATQYGEKVSWLLTTPYIYLESASIDEVDIETVPGFNATTDDNVFISLTYDGVSSTKEEPIPYGESGQYKNRFIRYRLGYVRDWFSIRMRGKSDTRVAFSRGMIKYG